MNVHVARAVDFGQKYALVGVFSVSLAGGLTIPAGMTLAESRQDHTRRIAAPVQAGVLDVPVAGLPPLDPAELLPRLEVAIAELPLAQMPPFDPAALASDAGARPMHGRLAYAAGPIRRQVTPMQVTSTNELARVFDQHDYTLDQARRGEPVPALQIDRVPGDLVKVRDGNERKELFIKTLLPILLETNERILADRQHLQRLRQRHTTGRGLSVIERMWLAEVADRYGTEVDDFEELALRVDIVPPSMAIAQAGVESGWGTSRAARTSNALFGQIQPGTRQLPQPFSSVADSVEAYIHNLNTHFAYTGFRAERARLRAQGRDPDGYHLIGQLVRYSELGSGYIKFVRGLIRENRLSDFDRARLPPI